MNTAVNPVEPYLLPALAALIAIALVFFAAHRWDVGAGRRARIETATNRMGWTWIRISIFTLVLVGAFVWSGDLVTAASGGGRRLEALPPGVSAAAGEQVFWGAGKCHTCHTVGTRGGKIRGPNLGASPAAAAELDRLPIGLRAPRIAEERAATAGSPMTGTDYLVESIANPSAHLVHGYKDEMPKAYLPPISLGPDQITSVILYLQSLGSTPDPSAIHLPPEIAQAKASQASTVAAWQPYFDGDSARGREVFFDAHGPAPCAKCHRAGDKGGDAGPDLTAIGATRPPQAIVASLVDSGPHLPPDFKARISVRDFHDLLAFLESMRPYAAGDTARGRTLFFDLTGPAACARCHRLGTKGGDAGPEIGNVVAIRSPAFLLEAILKPGKHIASGFETVEIRTNTGRTIVGVVVHTTPDSLTLGTADGAHVSVAVRSILERRAVPTSLMPDTLGKALKTRDLSDVMAFLETLR